MVFTTVIEDLVYSGDKLVKAVSFDVFAFTVAVEYGNLQSGLIGVRCLGLASFVGPSQGGESAGSRESRNDAFGV